MIEIRRSYLLRDHTPLAIPSDARSIQSFDHHRSANGPWLNQPTSWVCMYSITLYETEPTCRFRARRQNPFSTWVADQRTAFLRRVSELWTGPGNNSFLLARNKYWWRIMTRYVKIDPFFRAIDNWLSFEIRRCWIGKYVTFAEYIRPFYLAQGTTIDLLTLDL